MERYLGKSLFSVDLTKESNSAPTIAYSLLTAEEAGFKEHWLQQAIAKDPELVIGPCREAGLADEDEDWLFWKREANIPGVGTIDLLLRSEEGRVAIVETKLSYNAQGRRSVVAQLLDYAVNLAEIDPAALPDLPEDNREQVEDHIRQGDFLLIVAGDQLDPRAVRFARKLFGEHIVNEWALALVELAVFGKQGSAPGPEHLLVPHVCGLVVPEKRQVVKVLVEGAPGVHVEVERVRSDGLGREKWTRERFFAELEAGILSPAFKNFGKGLSELAKDFEEVDLTWGTGGTGSATLKRLSAGLVEFYLSGILGFRKNKLPRALGEEIAKKYLAGLQRLFPTEIGSNDFPKVPASVGEAKLPDLLELLRTTLKMAAPNNPR